MKIFKTKIYFSMIGKIFALILVIFALLLFFFLNLSNDEYKILHITHILKNNDKTKLLSMDNGIHDAFKDYSIKYKYRVFYYNKLFLDNQGKQKRFKKLTKVVESFKPDIIIVSGDDILEEMADYSKERSGSFVFIDVENEKMLGYNSTGIIKDLPAKQLDKIVEYLGIKKGQVVILSDNSSENEEICKKINEQFQNKLTHISVDRFKDWKEVVRKNNSSAKLFIVLNTFQIKNSLGKFILPKDIIKWTVNKSNVPEIGFDDFLANNGGLGSIYKSNYSKGYLAASKAIQILFGTLPSEVPVESPNLTIFLINKKRAKELNFKINEKYIKEVVKVDIKKR